MAAVGFRVLTDEHCERQVVERLRIERRLRTEGHVVERVVDVASLGPGSDDADIARYARREDRPVPTSDDDFLSEFDSEDHAGLLFVPTERLSPDRVATILPSTGDTLPREEIVDVVYVTESWV